MITTLTGTNSFLLRMELDKLTQAFVVEQGEMGLEKLDGEEAEFERLQEALTSLPFLARRKMVVLRAASANKRFIEQAEDLLKELPKSTELVLVEPKLDKRTAYYKLLKKQTDFREFAELDNEHLAHWLVEQAKLAGGSLSTSDARLLIDRVGPSQQLLASELGKLALYNPQITHQSIELLTDRSPHSTIFELLEAAFAGQTKRALDLYAEQRALKVEPPQLIAMLAWQLHVLALIKTAGERSPQSIATEAKINPFVVSKNMGIAHKLTLAQLKRLISNLLELDVKLKSQTIDVDAALQHFLLELSAK